ncbi:MAG: amidohydrolase, partial [Pseudoalteromonas spongiae]
MTTKKQLKRALLAVSVSLASFTPFAFADYTIFHNAKGYTLKQDKGVHEFSTLVIKDGKVVATGDKSIISTYSPAEKIDVEGKTLLPGLIDAHGHIIGLGKNQSQLDLRSSSSLKDALKSIEEYANQTDGWVIGRGWNQENWPSKAFPTAKDLDAIVSDRPVALTRVDGHALWVNSKALEIAGINKDTQAPSGGEIIRLDNGEPSGILIDNAEPLVYQHMPSVDKTEVNKRLDAAGEHLLSLGITSAHDAGIDKLTYQVYLERAANNTLPIRIYAMLSATDSELSKQLAAGKKFDDNDMLAIRSIKVYSDGALGSRGAALLEDYQDRIGHKGLMLMSKDELENVFTQAFKAGFSVNTHAIGDRANRVVLDTYEKVYAKSGGKLLRNRMEHAQIVEPSDIKRFKQLAIIPSMQPVHATSDMHMAEDRLGKTRLTGAYAWQTFLKQGSRVAAGSDFPVELANAFHGLYAAVSRQDKDGAPKGGWLAEEKLTREQALRA